MHQQQCQDRALAARPDMDKSVAVGDLERAEDSVVHVCLDATLPASDRPLSGK